MAKDNDKIEPPKCYFLKSCHIQNFKDKTLTRKKYEEVCRNRCIKFS